MKMRDWLMLAALVAVAPCASAGVTLGYEAEGRPLFTVEAPDHWTVLTGAEAAPEAMPDGVRPMGRVVSLMPRADEGALWVAVWSPPNLDRVADGRAFFEGLGLGLLQNPVVERTEPMRINGLETIVHHGTGSRDGTTYGFAVAFVQVARDRVAILAMLGEPEARERHAAALQGLLRSVRRAAGAPR
jgi:hypothetical protein